MKWPWRKRQIVKEEFPPIWVRPLTGIERHELEEVEKVRAEQLRYCAERRLRQAQRLAELKQQLAPQLNEIASLEAELNPYFVMNQLQAQASTFGNYGANYGGWMGLTGGLGTGLGK